MARTAGIKAARKLKDSSRVNRWADKRYKKTHLLASLKANALQGACQGAGIVTAKIGVSAKQPNSAVRKACRVQLTKNGKKVTAFVPKDGMINMIDNNDQVVVQSLGRRGRTVGDIPGCRFIVIKISNIGIYALFDGKKEKRAR
ncbi:Ribosomal_protein S23 [Hexamita inflata]|uniref:Ribosomal protein S23 n=1 Tax=Hexamita inflata TaxID=28002 RepID=A0AA86S0Y2_9EUKA|nr:Ribosomal protein S23 [Hexamita inflata]CAI9969484.1 Ribosomal protein S23 [Hexamita inflata]CAI9976145.1 Ribosomal protein S23 [Hexamita inflata]